jgi:hypothetical protein
MLRAVVLGVPLSVLAAACAMTTPPPPGGTVPLRIEVDNMTARPAELTVRPPAGMIPGAALPGAVQPPTLPAGSSTDVTFWVPPAGRWWIFLQDSNLVISGEEIDELVDSGCTIFIEFSADESVQYGCAETA